MTARARIADISVVLDLVEGAVVEPAASVEASIDCHVCGRLDRTVAFREDGATCIGTGHAYPGRLRDVSMAQDSEPNEAGRAVSAAYRVAYETADFVDPEHDIASSDAVTWARVRLRIVCPACGTGTEAAIQNNESRPRSLVCEGCGAAIGEDRTPQPKIETRPA